MHDKIVARSATLTLPPALLCSALAACGRSSWTETFSTTVHVLPSTSTTVLAAATKSLEICLPTHVGSRATMVHGTRGIVCRTSRPIATATPPSSQQRAPCTTTSLSPTTMHRWPLTPSEPAVHVWPRLPSPHRTRRRPSTLTTALRTSMCTTTSSHTAPMASRCVTVPNQTDHVTLRCPSPAQLLRIRCLGCQSLDVQAVFGGHDLVHTSNLYLFVSRCLDLHTFKGHSTTYHGNDCVILPSGSSGPADLLPTPEEKAHKHRPHAHGTNPPRTPEERPRNARGEQCIEPTAESRPRFPPLSRRRGAHKCQWISI